MQIYMVCFFGHREVDDLRKMEARLYPLIRALLRDNEYVVFLIGRNGEFDEYAASVIKRTRKEVGKDNSELVLVLPYTVADWECYEKYYDDLVVAENVYRAHPKRAITLRNRWMVEQADLVVVHVEHSKGGAYTAMQYAEIMHKKIVNLAIDDEGWNE